MAKVIFPDVFAIFRGLEQQLQQAELEKLALPDEQGKPNVLERHPVQQLRKTTSF